MRGVVRVVRGKSGIFVPKDGRKDQQGVTSSKKRAKSRNIVSEKQNSTPHRHIPCLTVIHSSTMSGSMGSSDIDLSAIITTKRRRSTSESPPKESPSKRKKKPSPRKKSPVKRKETRVREEDVPKEEEVEEGNKEEEETEETSDTPVEETPAAVAKQEDEETDSKPAAKTLNFPRTTPHRPIVDIIHERSAYMEPEREDGMTLYERHRQPRPVPTGRQIRPLAPILEGLKCAICLDVLKNTRIVMDCLHRFCEECIEQALKCGKHCPICRVVIPSRRSVAPDTRFDQIIAAVLGPQAHSLEDNDDQHEDLLKAVTLQKAIAAKRQEREMDFGGDDDDVELPPPPLPTTPQRPYPFDVRLVRHAQEVDLDDLVRPYLRMPSTTPIRILATFMQQKLGTDDEIGLYVRAKHYRAALLRDLEMSLATCQEWYGGDGMLEIFYRKV